MTRCPVEQTTIAPDAYIETTVITRAKFNHLMSSKGRSMAALVSAVMGRGAKVLPTLRLDAQPVRFQATAKQLPITHLLFGACEHEDWNIPGEASA